MIIKQLVWVLMVSGLLTGISVQAQDLTAQGSATPTPGAQPAQESAAKVPVNIKAILIDKDLNQRPIAKSRFTLISIDPKADIALDVTTTFNGDAQVSVPPGEYRLVSVEPVDFQGKRFSWNVAVRVAAPAATVEISNDNASTPTSEPKPEAPASSSTPAHADPNDPMAPHDPGIYLMAFVRDGGRKMILIERAGSTHEKTANTWGHAFSYGISKAKVKAELPGAHAAVRATVPKPQFYMYFPPTGNLGATDTISSPSQFSLLRLEDKKDHRETAVLKLGFGSASAGTDEKRVFNFDSQKLRPYVYRVMPEKDLPEGEYAFIASPGMGGTAAASAVVLYDFGVDLK